MKAVIELTHDEVMQALIAGAARAGITIEPDLSNVKVFTFMGPGVKTIEVSAGGSKHEIHEADLGGYVTTALIAKGYEPSGDAKVIANKAGDKFHATVPVTLPAYLPREYPPAH